MNVGIAFTMCAFFFNSLIVFAYFSKDRINTIENKIYGIMVIISVCGCLIGIPTYYSVMFADKMPIIAYIIPRLYLVYLLAWALIFTEYVLVISSKKDNEKIEKYYLKLKKILFVLALIIVFLIFVLPLYNHNQDNKIYTYGPAANLLYVIAAICVFVWLIRVLVNIKNIKQKKYFPVIGIILLGGIVTAIQRFNPGLLLITATASFITTLMYHTIENPDVKMINELQLAKNQAEKANRAKTDFLSSMSHEIRTPLNAIVCLSDIIKNSDDINEIHEDANDVVIASQNLLEIVNGILDISKIEADKMEVVETDYNFKETLEELKKLTEIRIGEKEIELRCDFAVDLPDNLYGDKGKIKQIATNLLTNAVKYTEKGFIYFNVSAINEKDECKLQITVSDTGRGIKREQMDKLFTKFNRLEEDMNTTIEGTGLGLAITKSLVELMGGKIVVHSTYGEGSKFTVFISQKISNGNISKIEEKDQIITFDNKRVLVVDDNALNIKVASKVLKNFNLNIDSVMSGKECLDKIKNNEQYDLILMDIMMPKMSGVETLKQLKLIPNFNTPVVALTADAIQGKSNKYIEVGFIDYLSKPIQNHELKRVLNKCLNGIKLEEKITENDPNIHKVITIVDNDIEILNKKLAEMNDTTTDDNKGNVEK